MIVVCVLCSIPLICLLIRFLWIKSFRLPKHVCVVVLGDLGRSRRIQYHALSFLKEGFTVDLLGYPDSSPLKELIESKFVNIHYLPLPPDLKDKIPGRLYYILKAGWQAVTLLWVLLLQKPVPTYLIMQNPPAVPVIPICWFYCRLLDVQFIIDWHNYAHSILALSLGYNNVLVKLTKFIEMYFGTKAHYSFCVTKAMKEDLCEKWNIKAHVLYDHPGDEFHPISLLEKHELLLRLSKDYDVFKGSTEDSTILTERIATEVCLLSNRPAFIISSTSWTEDEDFNILILALQEYEDAVNNGNAHLPDLLCVITGKGPQKKFYTTIIDSSKWKHIRVVTPWVENDDYPKLLASADLGVCLHTSSSGLDLPMKVVDMFGCCLPVCAHNFKCLPELIQHNHNSWIFCNHTDLTKQLKSCFHEFPHNTVQGSIHEKFQQELCKFQKMRWHENWSCNVLPYIRKSM